MSELIYASATAVAKAIRTKEVSSEEVVKAYVQRIKDVNPQLNAVVRLDAEGALVEARRSDEELAKGDLRGPLHGVPMTIKDALDTAGVISSGGTQGRSSFVPEQDATVVARLRAQARFCWARPNTPELTLGFETVNLVYGAPNNPYDVSRTCGGSSGGAAAIIAAGGIPLISEATPAEHSFAIARLRHSPAFDPRPDGVRGPATFFPLQALMSL